MSIAAVIAVIVVIVQLALFARFGTRLVQTARGQAVRAVEQRPDELTTVLVPVLDERERIGPCLDGASAQGAEVAEIIVVDGGSRDGTQDLVARHAARDPRIRLVDAGPSPDDWTGKAWGLVRGLSQVGPTSHWVLCIDADVRIAPALTRSLVAHANSVGVPVLSVATRQRLSNLLDGLVHPALLSTLVYRYGIPGRATTRIDRVQANGQCFLAAREVLESTNAFTESKSSLCEDVTAARCIAAHGTPVGFYEAGELAEAAMYAAGSETWRNWPRSLPLRDRYVNGRNALPLAQVLFVQALPLPLLAVGVVGGAATGFVAAQVALLIARIGVLFGTSRAYVRAPWTYWFRLCSTCRARSSSCSAPSRAGINGAVGGICEQATARSDYRRDREMLVARCFLVAHALAVAFALAGMLIALPNPELWADSALGAQIFALGMSYGGSMHILFGALAMASFGIVYLGWRRTAKFFVASVTLSLAAELLGVGTGWPFGEYEYTAGLGFKIMGLVPYSVPLSWFYMGMCAYLLAGATLSTDARQGPAWSIVALGAYFLTVWDVVLDPAMSHAAVPVKFWIWHEQGAYLCMPVKNFAGWLLTGLAFMSLSRALWGSEPRHDRIPVSFPFAIFAINMVFAMALSAAVGLWLPIVLSCALALAPACVVWYLRVRSRIAPRPRKRAHALK